MSNELDAVLAVAANNAPITAALSPESTAVFGYAWSYLSRRYNWRDTSDPYDEITDSQWDTIQAMVDKAFTEIMIPMIGQVIAFATSDPPPNVLFCDGSTYLRVDFPTLYSLLAPAFIVDADNFIVPDLRERFVYGLGGTDDIGDSGGSSTVTLTNTEMPAHSHTAGAPTVIDPTHSHVESGAGISAVTIGAGVPAPVAVPFPTVTAPALTGITVLAPSISSEGGGGSHNNMPPYVVLAYGIIAQ